jgi:tetratricopeptide (TPR) repeat protein
MNAPRNMKMIKTFVLLFMAASTLSAFSQPTYRYTDPEKMYKEAKELFIQDQYALAYPLFSELKFHNPENSASGHNYLNDDIDYYFIACELELKQPVGETEAKHYIDRVADEPRRQLLSHRLARYYFRNSDYENALHYYERAGLENLGKDKAVDSKFERAYCYFALKLYGEAKPLFEEISQVHENKYYFPANYYSGFISFNNGDYKDAMKAFKKVEDQEDYRNVVPYYIAQLLYFEKRYDEALRYGQQILDRGDSVRYEKELRLLTGQLYFEKKDFEKALPLLKDYVSSREKPDNEVLYTISYCYYAAKEWEKAIEGFSRLALEKDSLGRNSNFLLGDCYLHTGQRKEALAAFRIGASDSSNRIQQQVSRFNCAKLSFELGKREDALAGLKKYLKDYPGSENETEAKELLVGLLAGADQYADALEAYRSVTKPSASLKKLYPRLLYGRAVELVNDHQAGQADSMLTEVLKFPDSPITPYANFWKGEIACRNRNYDLAIRYLTFYQKANVPASGEANAVNTQYNLGYCWLQKENYPKALECFERVTRSATPVSSFVDQDAYIRSADCYFMQKDFATAGRMYDDAISKALQQSDYALYQKAIIAGTRSAAEKINVLNSIPRLYPKSRLVPVSYMEIADTYIADEKFRDAIPYLTQVLNSSDTAMKASTFLKLGLCYYNISSNKEALKNYLALIEQFPGSPEAEPALDNIRNIYVEEGNPNGYLELMQKTGREVSANEADSLSYNAALLKYNAGDCSAAIKGFDDYLSQYPSGASVAKAYYLRSECYDKKRDWNNALNGYAYLNSMGPGPYFDRSAQEAARICYFELKDYASAKKYFESLLALSASADNQLDALKGLVRCNDLLKDYSGAGETAQSLLSRKGISADDRSIALLVLGKSQQLNRDFSGAISSFQSLAAINKTAWGAEARYEIANCQFTAGSLALAEKSAMAAIKENASYDLWLTKSYILLGDVFMAEKDYFNARSTYESVASNSVIPELKAEAQEKMERAKEEEKAGAKAN